MVSRRTPKVVTVGGGHGQAALLAALRQLHCDVTALVSVADDGGCSGKLIEQFGMPPPGDLRRCLTTVACDRALAERFEQRLHAGNEGTRSAGNLALLQAYVSSGSLQHAVDWAAAVLRCWGRVVPVAETPGRLAVYDRSAGVLQGETTVARRSDRVMAVAVHGIEESNPVALQAIAEADVVLLGPGSFVTSTLAAVTTGQIAQALVDSTAPKVLLHNLVQEPGQLTRFALNDYVRMLRDHIAIHSHASRGLPENMPLTVLCHDQKRRHPRGHVACRAARPDGTSFAWASLADPSARPRDQQSHDPGRLAAALGSLLDLRYRDREPSPSQPGSGATRLCDAEWCRSGSGELADLDAAPARHAEFERFLRAGLSLIQRPAAVSASQPTRGLAPALAQRTQDRVTRS